MAYSSTLLGKTTEVWDLYDNTSQEGSHDLTENGTITYSTGKIYNAAYLEQANTEYLSIANASAGDFDPGTADCAVSFWMYVTSYPGSYSGLFLYGGDSTNNAGIMVGVRNNGRIYAYISDGGGNRHSANTLSSTISTATWHWVCVNWDRDGNMAIYVDDPIDALTTTDISARSADNIQPTDDFEIGGTFVTTLDGRICNFAISNTAIFDQDDRVELFNSKGGIEYGSEINRDYVNDANVYRVKVTAKSAQIGGTGNQDGHPLVITEAELPDELIDSDLSSAEASGAPTLRCSTDANGDNQIALHIVKFTPNATPANAVAEIWLRAPTLDGTNGTDVYLWWESGSGKTQPTVPHAYGANAVYPYSYKLALLDDDYSDATWNANDATATSMESLSTNVPYGSHTSYSFNGTSSRLAVSHHPSLNFDTQVTVELWVYIDTDTTTWQGILSKRRDTDAHYSLAVDADPTTALMDWKHWDGNSWEGNSNDWDADYGNTTWHHITANMQESGSDLVFKTNKGTTETDSDTLTGDVMRPNSQDVNIGAIQTAASTWAFWMDGQIKAIFVYDDVLTANQLTTKHNNQNAPGTFWDSTAAAEQPYSTGTSSSRYYLSHLAIR